MNPFDPELLAGIAQLGLGLAGFSGIGLVLTRTAGRLQKFELYRLGIMLGTAVGAMFLALLPLVLAQFAWHGGALCVVSAAIMAVFAFAFATYLWFAMRYFRRVVPEIVGPIASRAVIVGHAVNGVVQTLVALGAFERCAGWYGLGLLWLLGHATYQFWRILFIRPRDEGAA
ncbi:MAG TPA: hypothetical protein VF039_14050 [Longimicrobiales bacterium]